MQLSKKTTKTIGIDGRILTNPHSGGVFEYAINLIYRIIAKNPHIQFKIFTSGIKNNFPAQKFEHFKNTQVYKLSFPNKILNLLQKFTNFPKIEKTIGGADVLFAPHFSLFSSNNSTSKIIVFHDLSFEYHPNFFSVFQKYWHWLQNPKKQAQLASRIICVSNSTKNDLINLYEISSEKINSALSAGKTGVTVIYSGVAEYFRPLLKNDRELLRVKSKYKLPANFILYFGVLEPRKNITGLILAFEKIKKDRRFDNLYLVIGGRTGWLFKNIIKMAKKSYFSKYILFLQNIEDEERPYIYNLASIFVYPSFFEGFGLPPLEAMACGVPTIVSDNSSLPEVIKDGGILVNAFLPNDIYRAMHVVLNDENLKMDLSRRGQIIASDFSWDKTADSVSKLLLSDL